MYNSGGAGYSVSISSLLGPHINLCAYSSGTPFFGCQSTKAQIPILLLRSKVREYSVLSLHPNARDNARIRVTHEILSQDIKRMRDVRPMQLMRIIPRTIGFNIVVVPISMFADYIEAVQLLKCVDLTQVNLGGWIEIHGGK
jgi:hypothetical protein